MNSMARITCEICCSEGPNKDYLRAIQLCWDATYYEHQKELLETFMVLQAQDKTPAHVTGEDMKSWLTSQATEAFTERFQNEIRQGKDLCVAELAWEVNTRLKLDEMERELKHHPMSSVFSVSTGDSTSIKPVGESLSSPFPTPNLVDIASGETPVAQRGSSDEASNLDVVHQALNDMFSDLTYLPASRPQSASAVVVDLATSLLFSIGTDPANNDGSDGSPSMPLGDLAIWVIMSVLMDLSGALNFTDACQATKQLQMLYSRPVGIRIVRSILGDLQSVAGGPTALMKALSVGDDAVMAAILRGITLNVINLMNWDRETPVGWTETPTCSSSCDVQDVGSLLDRTSAVLCREIPVIHSATLNAIVAKLLRQIFSDAPSRVVSDLLCDWPLMDHLDNHLSAVLGMSVSSADREVNFSLEPAELQRIVDSVCSQLTRRSDSKMILQTSVSSKSQMVSRDIACLIVRAMMKLLPSGYSGGYSIRPGDRGEHCEVHTAEDYWAVESTGTVSDALFLHTIDRLVCNIFPIKPTVSVLAEGMRKHLCLSQQLWDVIQDLFAKAPKSKALQRVLLKLPRCEQDMGMMDCELGDMLYIEYMDAFRSKLHLDIDALIEDKELCLKVSSMVVLKLLHHWTPSVRFSVDHNSGANLVSAAGDGMEVKVNRATFGANFPDYYTIGRSTPAEEEQSLSTKGSGKSSKKGVRGFLPRLWKAVKCVFTGGCGHADPDQD